MPRSEKKPPQAACPEGSELAHGETDIADELTFEQAQAALELALAQLQSSDLEVEQMASLHRRAQSYARRCELLLETVEQEIMQWDPTQPDQPPHPFSP